MAEVYYYDSDNEIDGDFRMIEHDDNSNNDIGEHIPRENYDQLKRLIRVNHPT